MTETEPFTWDNGRCSLELATLLRPSLTKTAVLVVTDRAEDKAVCPITRIELLDLRNYINSILDDRDVAEYF